MSNGDVFVRMYQDLRSAPIASPRGSRILELEDYQFALDMTDSPLTAFPARNLNLNYAKAEARWYLRGKADDRSIEEHASLWPKIIQPDGTYFSNYGQYIFGERQYDWVVEELTRDRESRRASIVLLKSEHFFKENKDVVCTYGMNFRIRQNRLNMSVSMRSNDAIFGTTNDVFCFSVVYRMVFAALQLSWYPEIVPGTYTHKADSLHVYERHWPMLERLVDESMHGYVRIDVPYPNSVHDLMFLNNIRLLDDVIPPKEFALSNFLWETQ